MKLLYPQNIFPNMNINNANNVEIDCILLPREKKMFLSQNVQNKIIVLNIYIFV